jgi:hypothetical protein
LKAKLHLSVLGIAALFFTSRIGAQDVQVIATTKTNLDTETVIVTDTYLRGGMTNLICRTESRNGRQARDQKIYYEGVLLGSVLETSGIVGVSSEPNPTYSLTFQFAADKIGRPTALQSATINSNYFLVDAFICTNGILFPMETSKIRKAREIDAGLGKIFDSKNLHSKSSEEIMRQTQELIETNK